MEGVDSDDNNSLVNPLTPLNQISQIDLETNSLNIGIWDVREGSDTITSLVIDKGTNTSALLDDSVGNDLQSKCSSQPSILKELNSLRIKSNMERPRKKSLHKENKAFKISKRRRKGSNVGLEIMGPSSQPQERDEAKAILETGILMGLIPIEDEAKFLALIRDNLLLN